MRQARRSTRVRRPLARRAQAWALEHRRALGTTLDRLAQAPLGTALTAAVLGIALALPAGLLALLAQVHAFAGDWRVEARISVFVDPQLGDEAAERLAAALERRAEVARTEVIPRAQALEEYRRAAGFGEALALLEENPLPAVVLVQPSAQGLAPRALDALMAWLEARPEVDLVRLDRVWLERLQAMVDLARQAVALLAALLAAAVLLVVGNTIRLAIAGRREEIDIGRLFGATDAFIRRPFLYQGALLGLAGALIAWGIVTAGLFVLQGPVGRLGTAYGVELSLAGPGAAGVVALLGTGAALGLTGAWLAVGRHLAELRRHEGENIGNARG